MAGNNAVLTEDDDDDNVSAVAATEPAEIDLPDDPKPDPVDEVVEADEPVEAKVDDKVAHDEDERPRETAKQRRERAKRAKQRQEQELSFQYAELRRVEEKANKLAEENKRIRNEMLDQRLAEKQRESEQWAVIEAAAIDKNAGTDVVQARKYREAAEQERLRIDAEKRSLNSPAGPDADTVKYAQIFKQRHVWYNTNQPTEDVLVTQALDQAVAQAGFKPNTPQYWHELERRMAMRMPHHFAAQTQDDDDLDDDTVDAKPEPVKDEPKRKAPPVGGKGTASTGGTKYPLSPERVAAMKEAGIWDDPKRRLAMAKKYAEYDKTRQLNQ